MAALRADRCSQWEVDGIAPYLTTPISRKYFRTPGWIQLDTSGACGQKRLSVGSSSIAASSRIVADFLQTRLSTGLAKASRQPVGPLRRRGKTLAGP